MSFAEELRQVCTLLDAYAARTPRRAPTQDGSVPPEMQDGPIDGEGWVAWRMLPSRVKAAEVASLEEEFEIVLPPVIRAYLSARHHLFNQVRSRRHQQQVMLPATPADRPLQPLASVLRAWEPLIASDFVPFASWGDGWGPLCFDDQHRQQDGDAPVVWFEREWLDPRTCGHRPMVAPLAQPLYASCREFLFDVFA